MNPLVKQAFLILMWILQIGCNGLMSFNWTGTFLLNGKPAKSVQVRQGCVFYGYKRSNYTSSGRVAVVSAFGAEGNLGDVRMQRNDCAIFFVCSSDEAQATYVTWLYLGWEWLTVYLRLTIDTFLTELTVYFFPWSASFGCSLETLQLVLFIWKNNLKERFFCTKFLTLIRTY